MNWFFSIMENIILYFICKSHYVFTEVNMCTCTVRTVCVILIYLVVKRFLPVAACFYIFCSLMRTATLSGREARISENPVLFVVGGADLNISYKKFSFPACVVVCRSDTHCIGRN